MPVINLNTNTNPQKYGPGPSRAPIPRDNIGDAILAGSRAIGTKIRIEESNRKQNISDINDKRKDRIDSVNNLANMGVKTIGVIDRAMERRARLEYDQFKGQFTEHMNRATQGYIDETGTQVRGTYDAPYVFSGNTEERGGSGPYVETAKQIADFKTSEAYTGLSTRAKKMVDADWDRMSSGYLRKAENLQLAQFESRKKTAQEQAVKAQTEHLQNLRSTPEDILGGLHNKEAIVLVRDSVNRYFQDNLGATTNEDGSLQFHDIPLDNGKVYTVDEQQALYESMMIEGRQNWRMKEVDALFGFIINENNDEQAESLIRDLGFYVESSGVGGLEFDISEFGTFYFSPQNEEKIAQRLKTIRTERRKRIEQDQLVLTTDVRTQAESLICSFYGDSLLMYGNNATLTSIQHGQNKEQARTDFLNSAIQAIDQSGLFNEAERDTFIKETKSLFYMYDYAEAIRMTESGDPALVEEGRKILLNDPNVREIFEENTASTATASSRSTNERRQAVRITDKNYAQTLMQDKSPYEAISTLNQNFKDGAITPTLYDKCFRDIVRTMRYRLVCHNDNQIMQRHNDEISEAMRAYIPGFDPKHWFEWDANKDCIKLDNSGLPTLKKEHKPSAITNVTVEGLWVDGANTNTTEREAITAQEVLDIYIACQDYYIARSLEMPEANKQKVRSGANTNPTGSIGTSWGIPAVTERLGRDKPLILGDNVFLSSSKPYTTPQTVLEYLQSPSVKEKLDDVYGYSVERALEPFSLYIDEFYINPEGK